MASVAPTKDTLKLTVNGQQYYGWTAASVTRSLEAVAGGYSLGAQDKWLNQPVRWPILPGDLCTITIGDDLLITGFADRMAPNAAGDSHSIEIEGRDLTGDLVDSAAYAPPGSWSVVDFLTVASAIAAPYGIKVSMAPGAPTPGKLPGFVIQNGETAWAAIERAAKRVGVLAFPDGEGGVLIGPPGTTRCTTMLVEGDNLKAMSGDYNYKERFGTYMLFSQSQGNDESFGPQAAQIIGQASDAVFGARKRIMIEVDMGLTPQLAQTKAQWLATVRAARSSRMKVTVQGFRQGDGSLWTFNRIVSLQAASLGVETATDVMIAGVTYSISDEGGSETVLDLVRPDAFQPEPFIPDIEIWNDANNVKVGK